MIFALYMTGIGKASAVKCRTIIIFIKGTGLDQFSDIKNCKVLEP